MKNAVAFVCVQSFEMDLSENRMLCWYSTQLKHKVMWGWPMAFTQPELGSTLPAECLVHFFLSQGSYLMGCSALVPHSVFFTFVHSTLLMLLQWLFPSHFTFWSTIDLKKSDFSDRLDTSPEIFGYQQFSFMFLLGFFLENLTYYFGATQKTSAVCLVIVVSLLMIIIPS